MTNEQDGCLSNSFKSEILNKTENFLPKHSMINDYLSLSFN
jgi:hypothetical protein